MKNIILLFLGVTSSILFAQEKKVIELTPKKGEAVSFSVVEDLPVYPGCKGSKSELRKCLQHSIVKHVGRKFNTQVTDSLGLGFGKKKIIVQFEIDKSGKITNINAKAPHKALEEEGIRVVKLLPKMKPGKNRGRPVSVKYTLPITLKLE